MMSHDPKDHKNHTASDSLEEHVDAPLHDEVFGTNPEGLINDTPRGAIGANVNLGFSAVELEAHQPLRHIGDTDQADFQPGGGKRR